MFSLFYGFLKKYALYILMLGMFTETFISTWFEYGIPVPLGRDSPYYIYTIQAIGGDMDQVIPVTKGYNFLYFYLASFLYTLGIQPITIVVVSQYVLAFLMVIVTRAVISRAYSGVYKETALMYLPLLPILVNSGIVSNCLGYILVSISLIFLLDMKKMNAKQLLLINIFILLAAMAHIKSTMYFVGIICLYIWLFESWSIKEKIVFTLTLGLSILPGYFIYHTFFTTVSISQTKVPTLVYLASTVPTAYYYMGALLFPFELWGVLEFISSCGPKKSFLFTVQVIAQSVALLLFAYFPYTIRDGIVLVYRAVELTPFFAYIGFYLYPPQKETSLGWLERLRKPLQGRIPIAMMIYGVLHSAFPVSHASRFNAVEFALDISRLKTSAILVVLFAISFVVVLFKSRNKGLSRNAIYAMILHGIMLVFLVLSYSYYSSCNYYVGVMHVGIPLVLTSLVYAKLLGRKIGTGLLVYSVSAILIIIVIEMKTVSLIQYGMFFPVTILAASVLITMFLDNIRKKWDMKKEETIRKVAIMALAGMVFLSNAYALRGTPVISPREMKTLQGLESSWGNTHPLFILWPSCYGINDFKYSQPYLTDYIRWTKALFPDSYLYVGLLEDLLLNYTPPVIERPTVYSEVMNTYLTLKEELGYNEMLKRNILISRHFYPLPLPLSPLPENGIISVGDGLYSLNTSQLLARKNEWKVYVVPLYNILPYSSRVSFDIVNTSYVLNGYTIKHKLLIKARADTFISLFIPLLTEGDYTMRMIYECYGEFNATVTVSMGNESFSFIPLGNSTISRIVSLNGERMINVSITDTTFMGYFWFAIELKQS